LPQLSLSWRGFRKVRSQVCKRIRHRMQSLGLEDFAAYRDHLERHPQEGAMLDCFCRITISRFYRDRNVFGVLGECVLATVGAAGGARKARRYLLVGRLRLGQGGLYATDYLGSVAR
jgi:chemotaxis protein methyltransferase CheR